MPKLQGGRFWRLVVLTKVDESWKACRIRLCPPIPVERNRSTAVGSADEPVASVSGQKVRPRILRQGHPMTLLRMAAMLGFKGWTVPLLKKLLLLAEIGVTPEERKHLTKEREIIELLLAKILPDLSAAARADLLTKQRQAEQWNPTPLDDDAVDAQGLLEGLLEEEDVERISASARLRKARREASEEASETAVPVPLAPALRQRTPLPPLAPGQACYTVEEARGFLPAVPGCRVYLETKWHHRWRVAYPKAVPTTTSRSFGGRISEHSALMFCLAWVWGHHSRLTGEECPWEF